MEGWGAHGLFGRLGHRGLSHNHETLRVTMAYVYINSEPGLYTGGRVCGGAAVSDRDADRFWNKVAKGEGCDAGQGIWGEPVKDIRHPGPAVLDTRRIKNARRRQPTGPSGGATDVPPIL